MIEPGDVWVEYFLEISGTITNGMTEFIGSGGCLSITTDIPIDDPGDAEFLSNLLGRPVQLGSLAAGWGLDATSVAPNMRKNAPTVAPGGAGPGLGAVGSGSLMT